MNFATNYLGLHLHSPIVASASPLTENLDNVKRMEDAGAAAIVFHSLFEEQLHHGKHEFFPASIREPNVLRNRCRIFLIPKAFESIRTNTLSISAEPRHPFRYRSSPA